MGLYSEMVYIGYRRIPGKGSILRAHGFNLRNRTSTKRAPIYGDSHKPASEEDVINWGRASAQHLCCEASADAGPELAPGGCTGGTGLYPDAFWALFAGLRSMF